jgi:hypothetical protein
MQQHSIILLLCEMDVLPDVASPFAVSEANGLHSPLRPVLEQVVHRACAAGVITDSRILECKGHTIAACLRDRASQFAPQRFKSWSRAHTDLPIMKQCNDGFRKQGLQEARKGEHLCLSG